MDIHVPFGWFYLFNLITIAAFLLYYGIKKGYPVSSWITLIAWAMVFFLIGLKIMNFPVKDWANILSRSHTEPVYQKFVPGAALFFILGLFLIRRLLKFKPAVLDGLILILPLLQVVQRIGCFINGCCYGTPTSLPWAVHYHPGTSAYNHYLDAGIVQPGDALSCGIHPAQLYTIIGSLIVFAVMWRLRDKWKSPGGRVLFGVVALLSLRFIIEFFRENESWKWYSNAFLGFNYLQWILAAIVIFCGLILMIRERKTWVASPEIQYSESLSRNSIALLILIFLIWNTSRLFEFQELFFIGILMAASLLINLFRYVQSVKAPYLRYGPAVILVIAFATMSQDIIRTEADTIRKDPGKYWFGFGINGSTGCYDEISRNCSGDITDRKLKGQSSGSLNINYNYQPNVKRLFQFGLTGWTVNDKYISYSADPVNTWGLTPYVRYYATGGKYNRLEMMLGVNYASPKLMDNNSHFFPAMYLRLGAKEVFFVDAGYADELLLTGKPSLFHFGLGFGVGKKTGSNLRIGTSIGQLDNWALGDDAHLYFAGEFKLGNQVTLKPGLYVFNKTFGTLGLNFTLNPGSK